MKFVIGANTPDSRTNGVGRQMHGLGEGLASRGHSVTYLFDGDLPRYLPPRLSRLEFPWQAGRVLSRSPDTIAILHEPVAWPAALLHRMGSRTRVFAMVHGCEIRSWPIEKRLRDLHGPKLSLRSRILWPATELSQTLLSLRLCERVLCLASEDARYMERTLGVAPTRITRIDNGVDPAFLGRPEPGVTERPDDLLFLGSWIPRKGTHLLLEAVRRLAAEGIVARLTLAGIGKSIDTHELLSSLPEAWRALARIVPHVEPGELAPLYERHRIFVLPSAMEGIPLSMLEAMACGLCPVVTGVGGVTDVVRDDVTSVIVPPLDATALTQALSKLLRQPETVLRIGRAAHRHAQGYGWERAAAQVEAAAEGRLGPAG